MLKHIAVELREHIPFTALGAVTGIAIMGVMVWLNTPTSISEVLFEIFHPLHVLLSALVTTAMFRKHRDGRLWWAVAIGYGGSVGIATISDCIIPYLGGLLLRAEMEFHLGFIHEWWLVNPLALIGIALGYLWPTTKIPHFGHVLLSTWASLFYFTAFGVAYWLPLLPLVFVFIFLAVWLPCCVSDIVFPLLFTGRIARSEGMVYNHHEHG